MRVAILCQEEPLFLGPFLQGVMRHSPHRVAALLVAGRRTGGERSKTWKQFWKALTIYWLIFEPWGFLRLMVRSIRAYLLGAVDPYSVTGLAMRLGIPVYHVGDPNDEEFHNLLRAIDPDVVLNQSELLLKPPVLAIPRRGFVNRHASLLPYYRGRMASFWAHATEPPQYAVTIHFVDEGIDTGDIILQQEFPEIDPRWSYPDVMDHIQKRAPAIFWRAIALISDPAFTPTPQTPVDAPKVFPKLRDAEAYRETLAARREGRPRKPRAGACDEGDPGAAGAGARDEAEPGTPGAGARDEAEPGTPGAGARDEAEPGTPGAGARDEAEPEKPVDPAGES